MTGVETVNIANPKYNNICEQNNLSRELFHAETRNRICSVR